ncbi:MAG: hydrolase [Oscillospiraceae bacterium]|nr:hydrolase [Oscillospiraceae bacterium]
MSFIPTLQQARELVAQYNQDAFHLQHAETVSKVMGVFAREADSENIEYWQVVGMLHDLDWERWPEEHCSKTRELLSALDVDESVIRAIESHGYGHRNEVQPERYMEKVLFAVDELTGLIGAAALMRPTGLEGMELKSVTKKFKDKKFAAGCSRDIIAQGAEMLGMELNTLLAKTLAAMQES